MPILPIIDNPKLSHKLNSRDYIMCLAEKIKAFNENHRNSRPVKTYKKNKTQLINLAGLFENMP